MLIDSPLGRGIFRRFIQTYYPRKVITEYYLDFYEIYEAHDSSGKKTNKSVETFLKECPQICKKEIILNSIEEDGSNLQQVLRELKDTIKYKIRFEYPHYATFRDFLRKDNDS